MHNKKILAMAACAASLFSTAALAQAASFAGWSLGLNAESAKTTTSPLNAASDSGTSASLSLQPQYTWALGNNFVLGAGLTIGMGDNKSGTFAGGTQETAVRSRLSFDLQPGYAFSNNLLGYAKVSSAGATYELTSPGNPSVSTTLSGVSYGLGLRAMVSKGVFVQAEYDTIKYNRVLGSALWDIGVDANVFSLGLGYKF
jgi:outer membrane immunogenic protein